MGKFRLAIYKGHIECWAKRQGKRRKGEKRRRGEERRGRKGNGGEGMGVEGRRGGGEESLSGLLFSNLLSFFQATFVQKCFGLKN
jgi:hypothetical protein